MGEKVNITKAITKVVMVKAHPIGTGHRGRRLARAMLITMRVVMMIIGMLGDTTLVFRLQPRRLRLW